MSAPLTASDPGRAPRRISAGRIAVLLAFGLGGVGVLLWLGAWQTARLTEKEAQIAALSERLAEAPVALTGAETEAAHAFKPAVAAGRYDAGPPARFLTSEKPFGPGFRLIHAVTLDSGARILVDRGFAPEAAMASAAAPPAGPRRLTGVLHWPRETSAFTPEPNIAERLWFARDVGTLADALGAAPVLLALSEDQPAAPQTAQSGPAARWPAPLPVTVDLPNNHLGYAVTWFTLAAIWAAMTAIALRGALRSRR